MKYTDFAALGDVRIEQTSTYLPTRVVGTVELFGPVTPAGEMSAEELLKLTGVASRHVADEKQATSDLAVLAARPLLSCGSIDRLLLATVSPDYPSPATAPLVQHLLGLPTIPSVDVAAACAGYVYALDLAARAVLTGDERVLVIAAELRTRILDQAPRGVRCLFGDGAAASTVRRGGNGLRLLSTLVGADGAGHAAVRIEAGGTRHPTTLESVAAGRHTLRFEDGPSTFFGAVEGFVNLATELLDRASLRTADIALVVPHQPNLRILERVARLTRIGLEKFVLTVAETGNVGSASCPIALERAIRDGRIPPGSKVLLLTAGAGHTVGAAIVEATHGSELTGRVALITGASGGIGAACATLLAAEGAHVRLTGRDEAALDRLRVQITSAGHSAEVIAGDLMAPGFTETLVSDAAPVDILVHAAGHRFQYAKLHMESDEDMRRTRGVDEDSFTQIVKRALPSMMMKRFGRIVAVTSLGATMSGSGTPHYGSSKAALEALVRSLAVDYGRYGITSNSIAPGFTLTSRLESRMTEAMQSKLEAATSVKRLATPAQIAAPIAFLCSRQAAYITGVTLFVAGGTQLNNLW